MSKKRNSTRKFIAFPCDEEYEKVEVIESTDIKGAVEKLVEREALAFTSECDVGNKHVHCHAYPGIKGDDKLMVSIVFMDTREYIICHSDWIVEDPSYTFGLR